LFQRMTEYRSTEVRNTSQRQILRESKRLRLETRQPGANVRSESFVQSLKQHLQIVSIDQGMQIDFSDEQPSNADSPQIET
jgi:hypothetical protein